MTKIEAARQEYKDWCSAIGIDTIEKVNEFLRTAFKELSSQKFSVQSITCERSGKEQ